ncbi:unnamed protein product [Orchesella dallaii]|uniref:Uncharacterized protein n=1 Tax=Orchesella dallaii TaxID=48710 RepID=A0ABP1S8F1_9HEXA
MNPNIWLLAAITCIPYLKICQATFIGSALNPSISLENTTTQSLMGSWSTKIGNVSAPAVSRTLTRFRRRTCHALEPPGSRCGNDCHCHRHRYCTPYGWCHERQRNGRRVLVRRPKINGLPITLQNNRTKSFQPKKYSQI